MYKTIVARRTRAVFDALNRGDAGPLLDGLSDPAQHVMYGDHALSGSRSTLPAIREWYARLLRVLPDLRFDVGSVLVSGPPWRTTVVAQWSDRALDGRYENTGVNVIGIRWGKVHSIAIHCDSQRLGEALLELERQGVAEAGAEPVTDPPGLRR
jgi:ketosteroid isomerase-like protein